MFPSFELLLKIIMMFPSLLKSKLRALPDKPGCYLMRDAAGNIIYVGKASSLRKRVQSYFRSATLRRSSAKLRSLVHCVHDIDVITARSEADAILTEDKLIKDFQPRFNVLLRDDKRFPLLSVDLRQPVPRFKLCRIKRADGALYHAQRVIYFGPYISSSAAREALDFIERKYGLRKCSVMIPDRKAHIHCHADTILYCSAPCTGKISNEQYRANVDEAAAFLRGERPRALMELREAMEKASAELKFEKAAAIRDSLQLLTNALRTKAHIVGEKAVSPDKAASDAEALQRALGLKHFPTLIQAVDISNISGKHAVGSVVAAVNGICRPALYRMFRVTTIKTVDDAAMMEEVIFRHFRRLKEENKRMPDLFLVDGGISQLHTAERALRTLGIEEVALAGLAKKFEEIYMGNGGRSRRLVLSRESPALQLLQRIRDEAHRFAHSYHNRLRAKLIRESVLDEISGLGPQRKLRLLQHFGSVKALARAPEEKIAAVAGIGPMLARKIKAFLCRA